MIEPRQRLKPDSKYPPRTSGRRHPQRPRLRRPDRRGLSALVRHPEDHLSQPQHGRLSQYAPRHDGGVQKPAACVTPPCFASGASRRSGNPAHTPYTPCTAHTPLTTHFHFAPRFASRTCGHALRIWSRLWRRPRPTRCSSPTRQHGSQPAKRRHGRTGRPRRRRRLHRHQHFSPGTRVAISPRVSWPWRAQV